MNRGCGEKQRCDQRHQETAVEKPREQSEQNQTIEHMDYNVGPVISGRIFLPKLPIDHIADGDQGAGGAVVARIV